MGRIKHEEQVELLDNTEKKRDNILKPNPEANANLFSKITFLFLTGFFYKGCRKTLEIDDIAWNLEQQMAAKSKRNPSLMSAIRRTYGKDIAQYGILLFMEESIKLCQPLFMGRLIRYFRYDTPLTIMEAYMGFGALIILVPIQGYFSQQMGKCRRAIAARTDKRISIMNEILNGIRVIKMYSWEDAFSDVVADLRRNEMKKVCANTVFQSLVMGLFWSSGKLIILFAVLCFVLTGNDLSAERIFVAAALYNAVRLPVTLFLPFAFQFFFEVFLELEEFSSYANRSSVCEDTTELNVVLPEEDISELLSKRDVRNVSKTHKPKHYGKNCKVFVQSLTTTWQAEEITLVDDYAVKDLSFEAQLGDLIAVIGPVGAGKSSLLSSLLCETRKISGQLRLNGKIAYCSQDAWIFSGTIRENILFGSDFDQKKYRLALKLSALDDEISQFSHGDAVLVGDRGTSLSGGQRARISLARAIYSNADIFLLDDPLSAVDASVGRYLFEKCICGYLRDRIVILVTHQIQFLHCASMILLMKKGEVIATGSFEELKNSHAEQFTKVIQETEISYAQQASSEHISFISSPKPAMPRTPADRNKRGCEKIEQSSSSVGDKDEIKSYNVRDFVSEIEDKAAGAVTWKIYCAYIQAMCSSPFLVIPLIFVVFTVQFLFNLTDWWLNKWTSASEKTTLASLNNSTYEDEYLVFGSEWRVGLSDYMWSYTILTLVLIILSVIRCAWFRICQTVASTVLHQKMFTAVVNTKVAFFDKNSVGRVLNRFAKDVGAMDDQLSFVFFEFLMGSLNFTGLVLVIFFLNPLVFLPTLPLIIIFLLLRSVYLASSRDVKRLEATTRSPLYSHISAFMNGLSTVRAFGKQKETLDEYHRAQISAMCTPLPSHCPPLVGSQCVLTGLWQLSYLLSRFLAFLRQMVSIERIVQYTELESEHDGVNFEDIPAAWPTDGHINITNMFLKYDEKTEYVLKNICVDIKPGEKIGIVGRTGAGKSSLLRALFRLTPPTSGTVVIDNVNTALIPLKALRRAIAIIPQEPVLFIGSLRRNLDPFNTYGDDELYKVINQVLNHGEVAEFGSPYELLLKPNGILAELVEETGNENASVLHKMAEENYNQKFI
ncbi:ABC transporter, ATP-binding protein [Dictyocaulus viviparus]|uniref:ABC transporter, ATP-binding protein n=1 Tax=Dictyocaulus viviparus TaxID=29172 RepID=A0A0D8XD83_DICVI|nr:ABC transporter, ATP-binding protein [Dictyocaulus viviparus]